ncbi:hypothetical protein EGR_05234 [Echinococcus granulosus]|uniref:Uncharacterized protein n=1 Tax=Echinococcus granulosus TaxID=6210 RepID=W6UFM7_ECHGR|nr:hypothetical protein EGR_05234 [Echinococcus granulosus]EUB59908.1 hypothetical protein EGR_05234 [Echinococcus granulosus]
MELEYGLVSCKATTVFVVAVGWCWRLHGRAAASTSSDQICRLERTCELPDRVVGGTTMAAEHHLRVFPGYGTAVLTLICFALIVGAAKKSTSDLAEKSYRSSDQMGSHGHGDYQSMGEKIGHSHQGHMGQFSSGGQGSYHGVRLTGWPLHSSQSAHSPRFGYAHCPPPQMLSFHL